MEAPSLPTPPRSTAALGAPSPPPPISTQPSGGSSLGGGTANTGGGAGGSEAGEVPVVGALASAFAAAVGIGTPPPSAAPSGPLPYSASAPPPSSGQPPPSVQPSAPSASTAERTITDWFDNMMGRRSMLQRGDVMVPVEALQRQRLYRGSRGQVQPGAGRVGAGRGHSGSSGWAGHCGWCLEAAE